MAFVGGPQKDINSDPIQTKVGKSETNIFTATSTKPTQGSDGKVNGGTTTLYYSSSPDNYVPAATTKDGGNNWTYLKDSNGKEILGADAKNSLEKGALKNNTQNQIQSASTKAGIPKEQQKKLATQTKNNGTPEKKDDTAAAANKKAIEKDLGEKGANIKARKEYGNAKYPLNLEAETQDCLQITMIEYTPRGTETTTPDRRVIFEGKPSIKTGKRKYLGTVTLPIPAGIRDENSVSWQDDNVDELQKAFGNIAQAAVTGGGDAAAKTAENEAKNIGKKGAQTLVASNVMAQIMGSPNAMQRQYGAMVNPNMELLFNGPSLRSFSFTFRMSPRSKNEAKEIKKIIRFFKQGMSVKKTQSSLLLKSPNTFAISYVTSNKQHPYLNRFKECALQTCSVNYTPDGNYMTYAGEPSMTAYELSLSFKELEPIFDDDYGDGYENIGF